MFSAWKNLALFTLLLANRLSAQSPATFTWLNAAKSPKNQHTLALLRSGPEGFQVLRWQEKESDYTGKTVAAHPVLVQFNPGGDLVSSQPIEELEAGSTYTWHFAVSNDSLVLFVCSGPGSAGQSTLQGHLFDPVKRTWVDDWTRLFTTSTLPPHVWYTRSPDGSHYAIYGVDPDQGLVFTLLDRHLRVQRRGLAPWPAGLGKTDIREVFCSNSGELLVQARTSGSGQTLVSSPMVSINHLSSPLVWPPEDVSKMTPFALTLLLLPNDGTEFTAFYPKTGHKYAFPGRFAQQGQGPVLCAGFAGSQSAELAESYFIYQLDPATAQAQMLQNAPLAAPLRRAFLSEKDAADKKPVEHLRLRWLAWAADGRPWLLAEQENAGHTPVELNNAALLRLDSTYKVTAARPIEKYQRAVTNDPRFFGSLAAVPAAKGWWALWNKGNYPSASLMLMEGKTSGEPLVHELAGGARLVLGLLPHTQQYYQGKWYFVGESASGDRVGIGVLEKAGKK